MQTGREVVFSPGVYPVSVSGLNIPDGAYLRFEAGAELRTLANNQTGKATIDLTNKYQVHISGPGLITGDRNVHTGGGANMGVMIKGGANITIDGLTIVDALDGVYVGKNSSGAQGVTLANLTVENSKRNNLSIVSASSGSVTDCDFSGANGSAPQAGVDLEPNGGETVSNWTFTRCTFSGNTGVGVSVDGTAGTLANVQFIDCEIFDNASQYAVNIDHASNLSIEGGSITGGSNMQVHVARSDNITLEGVNIPAAGASNGIYFDFDVDTALVDDCSISNVTTVGVQVNHVADLPECTNVTVRNTAIDGAFYGVWFKAGSSGVLGPGMSYANCSDEDYVIDPAAEVELL
jgi:hypothetical protein